MMQANAEYTKTQVAADKFFLHFTESSVTFTFSTYADLLTAMKKAKTPCIELVKK